jgi:hypothetical protein
VHIFRRNTAQIGEFKPSPRCSTSSPNQTESDSPNIQHKYAIPASEAILVDSTSPPVYASRQAFCMSGERAISSKKSPPKAQLPEPLRHTYLDCIASLESAFHVGSLFGLQRTPPKGHTAVRKFGRTRTTVISQVPRTEGIRRFSPGPLFNWNFTCSSLPPSCVPRCTRPMRA